MKSQTANIDVKSSNGKHLLFWGPNSGKPDCHLQAPRVAYRGLRARLGLNHWAGRWLCWECVVGFGNGVCLCFFRSCFTSSALGCTQDKVHVHQMFMSPAGGRWLCATVRESFALSPVEITVGFQKYKCHSHS